MHLHCFNWDPSTNHKTIQIICNCFMMSTNSWRFFLLRRFVCLSDIWHVGPGYDPKTSWLTFGWDHFQTWMRLDDILFMCGLNSPLNKCLHLERDPDLNLLCEWDLAQEQTTWLWHLVADILSWFKHLVLHSTNNSPYRYKQKNLNPAKTDQWHSLHNFRWVSGGRVDTTECFPTCFISTYCIYLWYFS